MFNGKVESILEKRQIFCATQIGRRLSSLSNPQLPLIQ